MYIAEIDAIKADLGIEGIAVKWRWKKRAQLRTTRTTTIVGEHWYLGGMDHRIDIATERSYESIVEIIAHELRHAWQTQTGTLVYKKHVHWTGTRFVEASVYSRRKKYWNREHERDARAYASDAMVRLFQDAKQKVRQTPERATAALFALAFGE